MTRSNRDGALLDTLGKRVPREVAALRPLADNINATVASTTRRGTALRRSSLTSDKGRKNKTTCVPGPSQPHLVPDQCTIHDLLLEMAVDGKLRRCDLPPSLDEQIQKEIRSLTTKETVGFNRVVDVTGYYPDCFILFEDNQKDFLGRDGERKNCNGRYCVCSDRRVREPDLCVIDGSEVDRSFCQGCDNRFNPSCHQGWYCGWCDVDKHAHAPFCSPIEGYQNQDDQEGCSHSETSEKEHAFSHLKETTSRCVRCPICVDYVSLRAGVSLPQLAMITGSVSHPNSARSRINIRKHCATREHFYPCEVALAKDFVAAETITSAADEATLQRALTTLLIANCFLKCNRDNVEDIFAEPTEPHSKERLQKVQSVWEKATKIAANMKQSTRSLRLTDLIQQAPYINQGQGGGDKKTRMALMQQVKRKVKIAMQRYKVDVLDCLPPPRGREMGAFLFATQTCFCELVNHRTIEDVARMVGHRLWYLLDTMSLDN